MKFRFWAFTAALALTAAAPAHAQRDRDNASTRANKPHIVTSDSVERLNPISPLIAQRREIGLPDSLIGKLGAILARLDAMNAKALRQVDSLAAAGGAGSPDADEASASRPAASTVSLDFLIGQISNNNDTAAQEALNLLSGETASRALKLVNDQRNRLKRLLEDSGAGGRGR